jgi:hypothetical protein
MAFSRVERFAASAGGYRRGAAGGSRDTDGARLIDGLEVRLGDISSAGGRPVTGGIKYAWALAMTAARSR